MSSNEFKKYNRVRMIFGVIAVVLALIISLWGKGAAKEGSGGVNSVTSGNEVASTEDLSKTPVSDEDTGDANTIDITDEDKTDAVITDVPMLTMEAEREVTPVQEPVAILYEFRNDEYLQQHFEKHGAEFPYDTAEEYLAGANRVVQSPDALHKTEAEDGDDVYYLEAGNEFVIVSKDGYLRTYFRPSAGIDYYNRQ